MQGAGSLFPIVPATCRFPPCEIESKAPGEKTGGGLQPWAFLRAEEYKRVANGVPKV
jgi:hypothetical protein